MRGLEVLQAKIDVAGKRIHLGAIKRGVTVHVSDYGHFLNNARDSRRGRDRFSEHTTSVLGDADRSLSPPR